MKIRMKSLVTSTVSGILMCCVSAVQAQTVTLKFSHFIGTNHNFHKGVAEHWCNAIEKDSVGKLKCQIYPALQLGGTPAMLPDQVKNGVADVAWTSPSFATGRFPRTEALELPFSLPPSSMGGTRAMWEYTQKFGMEDYKDFKVLAMFSGSNVVISTATKPVLSMVDLKGLKLRSPSRYASMFLSGLGGTPVNMPVAQVTEGIAKGVIDGAMAPWEVLPAVKIDEVTKYHMEGQANQPGFTQTPFVILMNKARYEGLTPELKAVIDRNSGLSLSEVAAKVWDDGSEAAKKKLAAQGNKILTIKDADYNAMKKATVAVETDWVKQATVRGLDGAKLAAEVHALGQKYMIK